MRQCIMDYHGLASGIEQPNLKSEKRYGIPQWFAKNILGKPGPNFMETQGFGEICNLDSFGQYL